MQLTHHRAVSYGQERNIGHIGAIAYGVRLGHICGIADHLLFGHGLILGIKHGLIHGYRMKRIRRNILNMRGKSKSWYFLWYFSNIWKFHQSKIFGKVFSKSWKSIFKSKCWS